MTVETEVANLTTAVDGLTSAVNVSKATLDASVADAESAQTGAQSARDTTLGYKNSAEAAATSATNTASALTGFDLAAIDDTITDTAVDVFVYDTSKDSDGGAWRKRTQGTSWYNEALNTSTRGNRKEFPAVAVLVLESDTLTIYDGDDPSLPMWMVFTASGGFTGGNMVVADTLSSVSAKNAILCYTKTNTSSRGGLSQIDLLKDRQISSKGSTGYLYNGNIKDRNSSSSHTITTDAPDIVDYAANDVAMTVLPNAPVDAATGLPVVTVAVATGGGTSIIKDDGTVVDITFSTHNVSSQVDFVEGDKILFATDQDARGRFIKVYEIPSADLSEGSGYAHNTALESYQIRADGSGADLTFATPNATLYDMANRNFATNKGLASVAPDIATPSSGLSSVITSTYNTGWMNGDIKLATLSDTDDTDVVGSELVTNGTFATDSDWTKGTGWTIGSGVATATNVTQYVSIASTAFTTIVGKEYTASLDITSRSQGGLRIVARSSGGSTLRVGPAVYAAGSFSITFVAVSTSSTIEAQAIGTTSLSIDNVSVRLAEEDRSVNGNGLQVFGTVTKNPVATGADLVGYSGWNASNYLEQPYNSDLDFGTGDFSAMYWVNTSDGYYTAIENRSANNSSGWNLNTTLTGSTTGLRLIIAGTAASSTEVSQIANSSWTHIVAQRVGPLVQFYVNGNLVSTDSSIDWTTKSATKADTASLKIGVRRDGAQNLTGPLALLRISATAPSAEQIAKIYNDEKVLFQENAQATLHGTSDAVTALAYDDSTELLHVGTSQGRSVFQGLRRVENTTDAVGAAISASNNLVVEE